MARIGRTAWIAPDPARADLERRDAQLSRLIEGTIPVDEDWIVVVGRPQRFKRRLRDGLVWQSDVCASLEEALPQADERADEAAA